LEEDNKEDSLSASKAREGILSGGCPANVFIVPIIRRRVNGKCEKGR